MDEPFVIVEDDDTALHVRRLHDNTRRGVFILSRCYSRAYDLKLGADATVIILGNDASLSTSEAI